MNPASSAIVCSAQWSASADIEIPARTAGVVFVSILRQRMRVSGWGGWSSGAGVHRLTGERATRRAHGSIDVLTLMYYNVSQRCANQRV